MTLRPSAGNWWQGEQKRLSENAASAVKPPCGRRASAGSLAASAAGGGPNRSWRRTWQAAQVSPRRCRSPGTHAGGGEVGAFGQPRSSATSAFCSASGAWQRRQSLPCCWSMVRSCHRMPGPMARLCRLVFQSASCAAWHTPHASGASAASSGVCVAGGSPWGGMGRPVTGQELPDGLVGSSIGNRAVPVQTAMPARATSAAPPAIRVISRRGYLRARPTGPQCRRRVGRACRPGPRG